GAAGGARVGFGNPHESHAGPEGAGDEAGAVGGGAADGDGDAGGDAADGATGPLEGGGEAGHAHGGEAGRSEEGECPALLVLHGGGDVIAGRLCVFADVGLDGRGGLAAHGCRDGCCLPVAGLGGVVGGAFGVSLCLPAAPGEGVADEAADVVDEGAEGVADGGGVAGPYGEGPLAEGGGLGVGEGLGEGAACGVGGAAFEVADGAGMPFGCVGDRLTVHHTP